MLVTTIILKRIVRGLITLFAVSAFIFMSIELLPGDVAESILGRDATPEALAAIRERLNLDEPAVIRYFSWVGGVMQGDLGTALTSGRPVSDLLLPRLGNTLFLASVAAVIAVPLALTLGFLTALYRNTFFDRSANLITVFSISMPDFFIAYSLVFLFATTFPWFPTISDLTGAATFGEKLYVIALPVATLTLVVTAHMMRMTRASLINLLSQSYIEMAALKGAGQRRVLFVHALPNAAAPIAAVVALNLAFLITGVVVIEVVFVYPGLGQLLVDAVSKRDMPVVQASCLLFAATYITLNMIADVLGIVTNPRLLFPR
jgi:peptide/nickel transport system permease protein